MEIEYSKSAAKAISGMERSVKQNLKRRIEGLTRIPPEGDIKQMSGFSDGRMRLRVGKYRVVFKFKEKKLCVMDVGSRGDIYK